MKKKSNGMSPDMFHDAVSSTPIPVFTSANNEDKNCASEMSKVPEVSLDDNHIQTELIKVDFDKQTVSARELHHFFESAERFSKWFNRMISYGLVENVDFTAVPFWIDYNPQQTEDFTSVNNSTEGVPFGTPPVPFGTEGVPKSTPSVNNSVNQQDIGNYLLTIDAAKNIAMVQRNEKGKQARKYFINIEKLFLKSVKSTETTSKTPVSLFENLRSIASQCESYLQQMQEDYISKTENLEKQYLELSQRNQQLNQQQNQQIERSVDYISKKVETVLKDLVHEVGKRVEVVDFVDFSTISPVRKSTDENWIKQMVILHSQGKSYQMIKDEMNLNLSRQYIGRIIKNYKEKQIFDKKKGNTH